MGMYTEFKLDCHINPDAPEDVHEFLHWLVENNWGKYTGDLVGTHSYFGLSRMSQVCMAGSYEEGFLSVLSECKNYDRQIEHFMHWLTPYITEPKGKVIGMWHYEEWKHPIQIRHLTALQAGDIEL